MQWRGHTCTPPTGRWPSQPPDPTQPYLKVVFARAMWDMGPMPRAPPVIACKGGQAGGTAAGEQAGRWAGSGSRREVLEHLPSIPPGAGNNSNTSCELLSRKCRCPPRAALRPPSLPPSTLVGTYRHPDQANSMANSIANSCPPSTLLPSTQGGASR